MYGTLADIETDETDPAFRAQIQREFSALCGGGGDFWTEYARLCAPPDGDGNYEPDLLMVFRSLAESFGGRLDLGTAEEFAYRFRTLSLKKLRAYPEAAAILSALKARGAKIYLLSNAQACFTRRELAELSLDGYFDGILLSSEVGVKKPSEKFFGMLFEKFGIDKASTVYTGNDFYADVLGAKAAGLYCAYIDTYGDTPPDKVKAVADFYTKDFKTLKLKLMSLAEED